MQRGLLATVVGVALVGVLAFLRLVSNEIALRLRALEAHVEYEREERETQRKRREADEDENEIHDAEAA